MGGDHSPENPLSHLPEEKLERLLDSRGILPGFIDYSGNVVTTPIEDRLRVLAAMGKQPTGEGAVDLMLSEADESRWKCRTAPVLIAAAQELFYLRFTCPAAEGNDVVRWSIRLEEGETASGEFVPADFEAGETRDFGGDSFAARMIPLAVLPAGYHHLVMDSDANEKESLIIAAPERCHEPEWLLAGKRLWGASVQLYTLTSARNWGMGDFSDLQDLIEHMAGAGADFILLNPLHAPDLAHPEHASPYSPVDRRFLNPLYIAPDLEEDFTDSPEAQALISRSGFKQTLRQLKEGPEVDYAGMFAAKFKVFDLMFRHFQENCRGSGSIRERAFSDYVDSRGKAITSFAECQVNLALPGVASWKDPRFHLYLQWVADRQLSGAAQLAVARGMKVGVIRDLAVGSNSEGCEVRSDPALFCLKARVGAPPDDFNPLGQNWGFPPMLPDELRRSRFSHFIILLRENMRSCGALRIDHVMALMRLWWSFEDASDPAGAYVRYPVDELFAILRLESRRARCLVIGEDLGVVPPEIRPYLDGSGLLSNRVFYFEKYDGAYFRKPEHYPQRVLVSITNHDVPTLKAWWQHEDLKLRRRLNLIGSDELLAETFNYRDHEKRLLLQWLDEQSLLPEQWRDRNVDRPFDISLCTALFRACGTSSAQMVSVQLDDLAGMDTPVNVPGTDKEYPNWRRKIPATLEELFCSEDIRRMLRAFQETRDNRQETGTTEGQLRFE